MEAYKPKIYTVSQLNRYVKSVLEEDPAINPVFIVGEISNFKRYEASGHLYMSIKDSQSSVRAVMFRGDAQRLKFTPESGMSVILCGRVSVYERDGAYQVYISDMQPDGAGALAVAFEQLKNKLSAEGLFDDSRKPALPKFPSRVGVITSGEGAALRDILNVLSRRYPVAQVILCPVQVQGEGSSAQIAAAIRLFNEKKAADVLIVGRGGGSVEDLWAFNEEITARAVAASVIPVISGVGHETDFTICDFVASLRAPTPSAAAELAVPDAAELKNDILMKTAYLNRLIINEVGRMRKRLEVCAGSRVMKNPSVLLDDRRRYLDESRSASESALEKRLTAGRAQLSALAGRADALSPLKVLSRGYAVPASDGRVLVRTEDFKPGTRFSLRVSDGTVQAVAESSERNV
ncbi:MAG: exodeoxyribonuclease VII large subunit [Clostridiales bacterium]|nr:exodeoxyribonuclease VII large subunit [Clostridiales bacterium]